MNQKDILLRIKEILEAHKGIQNTISSREIEKLLGFRKEDTHVEARTKILETIMKYKLPIAATPAKGYYLVTTKKELDDYTKSLESRINKINTRKESIIAFFDDYYK